MVKLVEQYLARLSEEEHKKVQEAAEWLFQNGYIKSKSKLAVTRYALFTLVNIVNKKRAESQTAVVVPQTAMPTTTPVKIPANKAPSTTVPTTPTSIPTTTSTQTTTIPPTAIPTTTSTQTSTLR